MNRLPHIDEATADHLAHRTVEGCNPSKPSPFEQACADIMAAMERREPRTVETRDFANGEWSGMSDRKAMK